MGLFSRKTQEKSLPPAPLPPVAPMPQGIDKLSSDPGQLSKQASFLSAPKVPSKSSLDDVKSQVISGSSQNANYNSGSTTSNSNSNSVNNSNSNSNNGTSENHEEESPFGSDMNLNDDALFDFSSMDISTHVENNAQISNSNSLSSNSFSNEKQSTFIDTRENNNANDLSFISGRSKQARSAINDNLYVTTSQFKTFLEIIDQVKNRVKDSSDRHLRLLDIKSEEDIEYENLRRDFQYIEDKLYEIDSLIFDK